MRSLVISVDTEPDDQWTAPGPDGLLPEFGFRNTRGLHRLMDFFYDQGIPVTWMTSYSVARDPESAEILRHARDRGDEIAGHLHGWETPPFVDLDRGNRPFIYEYDAAVRLAKHRSLLAALHDAFDEKPVSYRSGRWGRDEIELSQLQELGYQIDSSIPPGIDFRDRGGPTRLGPDFRKFLTSPPLPPHQSSGLWHVPVSIVPIGPLSGGRAGARMARTAGMHANPSGLRRAFEQGLAMTGLQRLVWVRPLKHATADLARATEAVLLRGSPIVNVMFHSSEAFLDTSPLSRTSADVEKLFVDLQAIIDAVKSFEASANERVLPRTLRDAVQALGEVRKQ